VEEAGPGGRHHLVPVTLGLFDDAAGLVQVSGLNGYGVTIVLITHDRGIAARAPRQIDMLDGQIVTDTTRTPGGGPDERLARLPRPAHGRTP
jgi:hypothetical protein